MTGVLACSAAEPLPELYSPPPKPVLPAAQRLGAEVVEMMCRLDRSKAGPPEACDGAEADPCTHAAREALCGEPRRRDVALDLSRRGCAAGQAPTCDELGRLLLAGTPTEQHEARDIFRRLCTEQELAGACNNLGYAIREGDGGPADPVDALRWFERACLGEDQEGCESWGAGLRKGEVADAVKARAADEQACNVGCRLCCERLSNDLHLGRGGLVDLERARELYAHLCDQGAGSSCNNLGFLYRNGIGVGRDLAQATTLFERACALGDRPGCESLAEMPANLRSPTTGVGER